MGKTKFDKCIDEIRNKNDLKSLYKLWRKAHVAEVEEIKEKIELEREKDEEDAFIFKHRLYVEKMKKDKTHKNTISSHFVQFFYKNCASCKSSIEEEQLYDIKKQKPWEYVLANAFNMDGSYGEFDVKDGYKYICMLKEANDSKKVCIKDYVPKLAKKYINEWICNWKEENVTAPMLTKINNEFSLYLEKTQKLKCDDFTQKMAYMNVNKRGGTERTQGRDRNAVINYAGKYKEFILKEIDILSGANQVVTVFVCGLGKQYFPPLIRSLTGHAEKKLNDNCTTYEYEDGKKTIRFINIPHPSGSVKKEKLFAK